MVRNHRMSWRGASMAMAMMATMLTSPMGWAMDTLANGANIDRLLRTKGINSGNAGVVVIDLDSGEEVYAYRPDAPVHPASVGKLFGTAAALYHLHPEYTFDTRIYADGRPDANGMVNGNLYIKAGGDPFHVPEQMFLLADKVRSAGVAGFSGQLILDLSVHEEKERPATWPKDQASRSYAGQVSPLTYFFNTVVVNVSVPKSGGGAVVQVSPDTSHFIVRNNTTVSGKGSNRLIMGITKEGTKEVITLTGSLRPGYQSSSSQAVLMPEYHYAHAFLDQLASFGVKVGKDAVVGAVPEGARLIATHESRTLTEIVRIVNLYSNNIMAELLTRHAGGASEGFPGSTEKGFAAVRKMMAGVGVPQETIEAYQMVDGSGLSRDNRVSTRLVGELLYRVYREFEIGPEFMVSLGVSGAEGTLRKRMASDATYRMVRGKTGTVSGVASLAGYLESHSGKRYAYAVILNGLPSVADGRKVIDQICMEIMKN